MSGPSATAKPMSAKIAVSSSITWVSGCTRPCSAGASRTGRVTSMVSDFSRASNATALRTSRRSARARLTASFARLIFAPSLLRSSGDILPSVASSAEIEPFLPSAATRTASSAASSLAAAMSARIDCSSVARSDMAATPPSVMPGLDPGIHLASKGWIAGASPAMTMNRLRRQRGLGLFGDRLECRRLVDGEIRQHLAVHRDARLRQAVDKHAVGHAERTHRGIDALDPECAEGALLALAVAEGILPGLVDRGLGGADGVLAAAGKTLGGLVDFLVLGVSGHTAFDARHDVIP